MAGTGHKNKKARSGASIALGTDPVFLGSLEEPRNFQAVASVIAMSAADRVGDCQSRLSGEDGHAVFPRVR